MALILSLVMGACGSSDDTDDTKPTTDKSDNTTKDKDGDKTFTVTFDLKGGTGTIPDQTIKKGDRAKVPTPQPTRTGYRLTNWYTDEATTEVFAFTTPITADITLYARWTPVYTVTFDGNGGTGTAPNQTIKKDDKATKPATPTKDGYVFKGWYKKQDGSGTAFAFDTSTITEATTLYARWTAYSVTVTTSDGTDYTLTPDDKILSIVVNKDYAALHAIAAVTLTTVNLPGTTNPEEGKSLTLADGRGTITVTQGGVATPYTVKLMIKPTTKGDLEAIINAAGNTANLNFVDTSGITDMSELFKGKTFNGNVSEWDTSNVTDMSEMFSEARAFNQDIGNWDTAEVTNMELMFSYATAFKQDIGNWKTGNVTTMGAMFSGAFVFNQAIGNWDTSNVENMGGMFYLAAKFNQDIRTKTNPNGSKSWDVSKVTNMASMFDADAGASAFNQNIGNWDTSSVIKMGYMFNAAKVFNQDISGWDTSNVIYMNSMFNGASAFNQNIGNWNTTSVINMTNMFSSAKVFNQNISTKVIDGTTRWDVSNVTNMNTMFNKATAFNQDLSKWNVAKVAEHNEVFVGSAMATKTAQHPNWP